MISVLYNLLCEQNKTKKNLKKWVWVYETIWSWKITTLCKKIVIILAYCNLHDSIFKNILKTYTWKYVQTTLKIYKQIVSNVFFTYLVCKEYLNIFLSTSINHLQFGTKNQLKLKKWPKLAYSVQLILRIADVR